MHKRKYWLLAGAGLIIIVIIILLIVSPFKSSGRNLPDTPDYSQLPESMVRQIKAASKMARNNPTSDNLGNLGMVYHSNTFYKEAKEGYLLAINSGQSDWKWYYYLGYLYSELGESVNVIEYLNKVLELNPNLLYAAYYLGEAYVNNGNNEEAEKIFTRLAYSNDSVLNPDEQTMSNIYPLSLYAQFRLARLYMATSRMDKAMEILKLLTGDHKDFGPGFRLLSQLYSQLGNQELSNENLIRAGELNTYVAPVDTLIDKLALISQSPEYIMKQIDITALINPLWAKKLFDKAIITLPDNQYLLSKGIKLYLNYGFEENLSQNLTRHIKFFTDDFNELQEVATIAFYKSKYKLASIYLERCTALQPRNLIIRSRLSVCYLKIGMTKESVRLLEDLINEKPDSIRVLSVAVSSYMMMGDKNKVQQILQKMESLTPGNHEIYSLKARIALSDGNMKLADDYYLKAYERKPDDIAIIIYLGKRYIEQKLWKKSFEHFKAALKYLPNEPVLIEQIGELYLNCPDEKLKDITLATYYIERAFYSTKSSVFTKISAGKNLANLYLQENYSDKAFLAISKTLTMAKAARASEDEIRDLQDFLNVISTNKELDDQLIF